MHGSLDSLEDFIDKRDAEEEVEETHTKPEAPYTNGSLSVVVPMDDMELILTQMWKSRQTEPKMGELYDKYKKLTTFE